MSAQTDAPELIVVTEATNASQRLLRIVALVTALLVVGLLALPLPVEANHRFPTRSDLPHVEIGTPTQDQRFSLLNGRAEIPVSAVVTQHRPDCVPPGETSMGRLHVSLNGLGDPEAHEREFPGRQERMDHTFTVTRAGEYFVYAYYGDYECTGTDNVTVIVDEGTAAACANDKDDDGDGRVDHPTDPGCSSREDDDERDPDADGDGVPDWRDQCPGTPSGMRVNGEGCPDQDGDGVRDQLDNCIDRANADQKDSDGDLIGDACTTCPMRADARPLNQRLAGGAWTGSFSTSGDDGFVLSGASIAGRYIAARISLPYVLMSTSRVRRARAELTVKPTRNPHVPHSRLVRATVESRTSAVLSVVAEYAVDNLGNNSKSCVRILQRYVLRRAFSFNELPPRRWCEPFGIGVNPCARLVPHTSYTFVGAPGESFVSATIPQRLHFLADRRPTRLAGLFLDCDRTTAADVLDHCTNSRNPYPRPLPLPAPLPPIRPPRPPAFVNFENPVKTERVVTAVRRGRRTGDFDNVHLGDFRTDIPAPGCWECVHIHWRWGRTTNIPTIFRDLLEHLVDLPEYDWRTDGKPLVPTNSPQQVRVGLVTYTPAAAEFDPRDWGELVHPRSRLGPPVVWYEGQSTARSDSFFQHGIFVTPHRVPAARAAATGRAAGKASALCHLPLVARGS